MKCLSLSKNKTMNILLNLLEKSKQEGEYLSFYTYEDSNGFYFGKVLDYNEEVVNIRHYTKYGKTDGIIILKLENLESVDFEDDYQKSMKLIIENSDKIHKENLIDFELPKSENWRYLSMKQLAKNGVITNISLSDDSYTGYVKEVDEEFFVFHFIGKNGEDFGFGVRRIEDINEIRVNDLHSRKTEFLYKNKHNLIKK